MGRALFARVGMVLLGVVAFAGCAKGSGAVGTGGTGGSTGTVLTGTGSMSTSGTNGSSTTGSANTTSTGSTGGAGSTGTGTASSSSTGMMGSPLGTVCMHDSDCASMLCKPVVLNSDPVCVTPCTQQSDCSVGTDYFCEPITAGSTNGYCIPHSPAHCLSCMQDSDCGSLSESCFTAPGDNTMACHIDCSLGGQNACPSDYHCVPETVNGQARQLCRPKTVPTCLDAIGGYCDRLAIPQDCVRTNTAGNCIGQRQCLTASHRFDKCGASSPQCKTDCSIQDPAGCMESFCAGATSGVTNCGMCGHVCVGYQQTSDNVTCDTSQMCTFSCQGENYDVDGNPANGCEVADAPVGNHTQNAAVDDGQVSDCDSPFTIGGRIVSDMRVHENPAVVGFDASTGSAPDWLKIFGVGHTFCQNNVVMTLQMQNAHDPGCYHMTIITDKNTYNCQTDGSGACNVNASSSGQFSDNTWISIEVTKTCGGNDNVSYSISGHL